VGDEGDAGDGFFDGRRVAQIPLDELDLPGERREVLAPSGGEVVEHPHPFPPLQQELDDVGADESVPAGDDDMN